MRPAVYQHAGPATRAATHPAAAPPSGLLAALTLLLVAWTNVSLGVGLLYLTAFLTWAASCAPATARGGAGAKRLWATVSGLSALCLLVQLFLQARSSVDWHFSLNCNLQPAAHTYSQRSFTRHLHAGCLPAGSAGPGGGGARPAPAGVPCAPWHSRRAAGELGCCFARCNLRLGQ